MTAVRKPVAEIDYPESDGMPMAESDLHRDIMVDLINRLKERFAKRKDVYVTGNLLVYYEKGQRGISLAPDCMVVFGVQAVDRRIFKTWEEGAFPSVVFEITSKTTQREDMLKKFRIYEGTWRVQELFMFDPTEEYLEPSLIGFRMNQGELRQLQPTDGRLRSKELGITLERNGHALLLRDAKSGKTLPLPGQLESEERIRATEAEVVRLRAELDALKKRPKA
jgi:Uma2 family endonuclease